MTRPASDPGRSLEVRGDAYPRRMTAHDRTRLIGGLRTFSVLSGWGALAPSREGRRLPAGLPELFGPASPRSLASPTPRRRFGPLLRDGRLVRIFFLHVQKMRTRHGTIYVCRFFDHFQTLTGGDKWGIVADCVRRCFHSLTHPNLRAHAIGTQGLHQSRCRSKRSHHIAGTVPGGAGD